MLACAESTLRSVSQLWISANQRMGPTVVSQRYSIFFKVWLRAVLARVESLFSRISPRKRIFKKKHFYLFISGPDKFRLMRKKLPTIWWHCHINHKKGNLILLWSIVLYVQKINANSVWFYGFKLILNCSKYTSPALADKLFSDGCKDPYLHSKVY